MSLRLLPEEYDLVRLYVLARDEWKCRNCRYRGNLHVHHIVYRSEGGLDGTWNLVTLCNACHAGVHAFNLSIWAEEQFVGADGKLLFTAAEDWKPGM